MIQCLEVVWNVQQNAHWHYLREAFKNSTKHSDRLIIVYIVSMCDNLKHELGYWGNKAWYHTGRSERGMKAQLLNLQHK